MYRLDYLHILTSVGGPISYDGLDPIFVTLSSFQVQDVKGLRLGLLGVALVNEDDRRTING